MIRRYLQNQILDSLKHFQAVLLTGARQVGKTTLARQVAHRCERGVTRFDLENPEDLARLTDPMLALRSE